MENTEGQPGADTVPTSNPHSSSKTVPQEWIESRFRYVTQLTRQKGRFKLTTWGHPIGVTWRPTENNSTTHWWSLSFEIADRTVGRLSRFLFEWLSPLNIFLQQLENFLICACILYPKSDGNREGTLRKSRAGSHASTLRSLCTWVGTGAFVK